MARALEPDPKPSMGLDPRRGFPFFILFGRGEATLALIAALIASGGSISGPWLLGAWLLAEGGWSALRWLFREASWDPGVSFSGLPSSLFLPYLQSDSPVDAFLRTIRRLVQRMAAQAREAPELPAAITTTLIALGVGIGLVGGIGIWLTLGVVIALALARRLQRQNVYEMVEGWITGTLPWWLGLAGGHPSVAAFLAGIPIGVAWTGLRIPGARWLAWPLWVAWVVALGHGPGAYGIALLGLLLREDPVARSPHTRRILWAIALALTAWVLRTLPGGSG